MRLFRRVKIQKFTYNDDREVILPDNARIVGVGDGFVWAEIVVDRFRDE